MNLKDTLVSTQTSGLNKTVQIYTIQLYPQQPFLLTKTIKISEKFRNFPVMCDILLAMNLLSTTGNSMANVYYNEITMYSGSLKYL